MPTTPTARRMVMAGIDESLTFYPLRIAVLTVSDTRNEETDKSGALLAERLTGAGHELAGQAIVADDDRGDPRAGRSWADDDGSGLDHLDRRHRLRTARRHARSRQAAVPTRDGRVRGAVPPGQRRNGRTVHARSRAPLPDRSTTPSSSACRARPAPAAMAGTWSCRTSSTAATGPARSRAWCRACGSSCA